MRYERGYLEVERKALEIGKGYKKRVAMKVLVSLLMSWR